MTLSKFLAYTSLLAISTSVNAETYMENSTAASSQSSAADDGGIADIVVTAQKRSESANKVGMSITALSADTLLERGITDTTELAKVVSGFVRIETPRGAPAFAIRGIGFDDNTLGSASTVATYVDEVPLSYSVEARFPALDVERVEVLKGPQGILFGQNSTAGAINFIAAKPTQELSAGITASYGRFDTIDARGFISGPLTDNLAVRISAAGIHSNGWQKSYTRDETLGSKRQFAGRMLAVWTPTDALTLTLNVNGWVDKSDTQAGQLIQYNPQQGEAPVINANGEMPFVNYPVAPLNARAADWDGKNTLYSDAGSSIGPHIPLRRDDDFIQASLRGDYVFNDNLTLTSITAWSRYNQRFGQDIDGTALVGFLMEDKGSIRSFNQEVRLTGDLDQLKFIIGGNYSRDISKQANQYWFEHGTVHSVFVPLLTGAGVTQGGFGPDGFPRGGLGRGRNFNTMPIRNIAAFGNVEYRFNDLIKIYGGLRWTQDERSYSGCTGDVGDGRQAYVFNQIFFGGANAVVPGGCSSYNEVVGPDATITNVPGLANFKLKQDNLSWRAGVDLQLNPTTLLYANVTKGYKSGSFPAVNVTINRQLEGVKQESVLHYEAGVKASLFDRKAQFNAAIFYDDYTNKQLRGRIYDPIFDVLERLFNVPKSEVYGAEVELQVQPVRGLSLSAAGTYLKTKVTKGPDQDAFDPLGNPLQYEGLPFPHAPKWMITASADYEYAISDNLNAFIGTNLAYRSATTSLFNDPALIETTDRRIIPDDSPDGFLTRRFPANTFAIKGYATVDARAGVADAGDKWRAWIWGKNIFNKYYWTNVNQSQDSIYRLAGMPATYGATVSFAF